MSFLKDVGGSLIGGGSLLGLPLAGYSAGKKAGKAQLKVLREAIGDIKGAYAPYTSGGDASLIAIADMLGLKRPAGAKGADTEPTYDFKNTPGYEFRLKQGQDTLESSAAASGGLFSGATGRDLVEYGQEYASSEFDKSLARLFQSAGMSLGATQSMGAQLSALFPELAGAAAQRHIMPYQGAMSGIQTGIDLIGAFGGGGGGP